MTLGKRKKFKTRNWKSVKNIARAFTSMKACNKKDHFSQIHGPFNSLFSFTGFCSCQPN